MLSEVQSCDSMPVVAALESSIQICLLLHPLILFQTIFSCSRTRIHPL